jgi:hypothetical protein
MNSSEFYIGWMPEAPKGFAKHIREVVILLMMFILTIGVVLSIQQRKFSTSTFEYGQLTEVTGTYLEFPVPSLKVLTHSDAFGRSSFITIPLVGYGKFGSEDVVNELEKEGSLDLDKKQVTFKGTLIYHDGKTLLQIDKNDNPLVNVSSEDTRTISHDIKNLGIVQLTGEILDPKCYFGVMKPGSGKPHRDCAIRCIEGGMSPVFMVRNEKGESDYYLVLDKAGKKMNGELKDHIAEPVSLTARAVKYDDWVVLYTEKESIKRIGGLSWFKPEDEIVSCGR